MPTNLRPAPPEMTEVVQRLIAKHFKPLRTSRIALLVRDRAEETEGDTSSVAAAGVNSDPSLPFEYVVWVAWEVWQMLDATEREAILFHELMHCGRDEAGRPMLKPHDAGVFNEEIELYGVWWKDAQKKFKKRDDAREGEGANYRA